MRVFNLEIWTDRFEFVSHAIVKNPEYNFDYLSLESNKVKVIKDVGEESIRVERGNYIRLQGDGEEFAGIVTGAEYKDDYTEIAYKHILKVTDVNVHYDRERLKAESLETWLADIIKATYINNTDSDQNIAGLEVQTATETESALLDLDENIGNLNDILQKALINYNVVADAALDPANGRVLIKIGRITSEKTIEADLPNIKNRYFRINEADAAVNKITIYNRNNEMQFLTYYLDNEGNITTHPEEGKKICPVIFDTEYIEYDESGSGTTFFADKAYERALNKLTPTQFDNLIKLEVESDDALICPGEMQIGQIAAILHDGKIYNSILTGKSESNKTILMFGKVRNELTKKLRRVLQ